MKQLSFLQRALIAALSFTPVAASWGQVDSVPASGVVPDRFIVVLKPSADRAQVAARHGLAPDLFYAHALNGFAGVVPPGRLRQLQADRDVVWIEPDKIMTIVAVINGKPVNPPPPPQPTQLTPPGILRVKATPSPSEFSAVGIAIIDTGIDLTHPDLNVKGNVSFVPRARSGNDDNGHGTHCAGIAAAINNGIGVVGVAPNARLYAVKVLDRSGNGYYSWVIGGVDWVTKNAQQLGIKVANMSLGGPSDQTLNTAIANSVAAGVAYCVAAGNNATDASSSSPANCDAALTVSAMVATDGECGGIGPRTGYGADDTFATFSNFGPFVHIAAPGVNVYSTYKGGSYATMSGTSMATPHVTGAAARYIASHSGTPYQVYAALIAAGTPQADPCGFTGDHDGVAERLLNVSGF